MGNTVQLFEIGDEVVDIDLSWGEWARITDEEIEEIVLGHFQDSLRQFLCDGISWDYWAYKCWEHNHLRLCLSKVLQCDTAKWDVHKMCVEMEKLHPPVTVSPSRLEGGLKRHEFTLRYTD